MISTPKPNLTPRLTLRVGVTGHRPDEFRAGQLAKIAASARAVLACMARAASEVQSANQAVLMAGAPDLRLVTSLAEGADTIVAAAARDHRFQLDVILPFQRDEYIRSQKFSPEAARTFDDLLSHSHSVLELDYETPAAPLGYLAAGRLVVAHSDVLIAVWNGLPEKGVGGTAQVLRIAVEQRVPVVWIDLDGNACLFTGPGELSKFEEGTRILEAGGECSNALAETVRLSLAPPARDSEADERLKRFLSEPTPTGSWWSWYNLMRFLLAGKKYTLRVSYAPDEETEAAWTRFRNRAEKIGGEQFRIALTEKLEARWRRADAVALHYGHAYRSAYILNFLLAGIAVVTGLASTFWWNDQNAVGVKAIFVSVEVLLIGIIVLLTWQGGKRNWHVRWLEARSLAELLRPARLLALIGNAAAPQARESAGDQPDFWVEWLVRATHREIGPPTGLRNAEAWVEAIDSAVQDEIDGQIGYNHGAEKTYEKIDHKLHICGQGLFVATLLVGMSYIGFALLYLYDVVHPDKKQTDWIKAGTTLIGGGFPALGAALFGIKTTGDFKLAGAQCKRTLEGLEVLRQNLDSERQKLKGQIDKASGKVWVSPKLQDDLSHLFSSTTRILASDVGEWAKVYRVRQLTLPG